MAEKVKKARVILFKGGDGDKAVSVVCEGAAAAFVQDVSDTVIADAEEGETGDFFAGIFYTFTEDAASGKRLTGVMHSVNEAAVTELLASVIADCAVKHSDDPKRVCGLICDRALAKVRSCLLSKRRSAGGLILPDKGLLKGGGL